MEVYRRYTPRLISADAMQVYRGLNIGTGKEPADVLRQFPHEGIDNCEVDEAFDAQAFIALADAVLARGERVLIVGGTTLYVHALLYGLVQTPDVDVALRAELEDLEDPHGRLQRVDPVLAARLHPNDRIRIVRGLEVFAQTGQRLSELQAAHQLQLRHPARVLWLDRDDLRVRIDARVDAMMEAGYLDEVRGLLDRGVDRALKPMQSLGYRHLADHLCGEIALDEAVWRIKRDTWRFARKQRNSARRFPDLERVPADDIERVLSVAQTLWGPGEA
jgi:tRNA dimethylallyltransferase